MDIFADPSSLNLHVLIETKQGETVASIAELANVQVKADTRGEALVAIQSLLQERLSNVEILPLTIAPKQTSDNPWIEFTGFFEGDDEFAELAEELRLEREFD
ncbi:MAG: hypothetical protein F6K09_37950, partial [Merismopedia sp. SIO2A8]|nr:hypothetical protein [Merismopedia sp. SIO2A8]